MPNRRGRRNCAYGAKKEAAEAAGVSETVVQDGLADLDSPDLEPTPYGVYGIAANDGFVNVGISHDTAEFAVDSIRRWWRLMGGKRYPRAERLFITADGGGSNGSRNRLWKIEMQKFANEIGKFRTNSLRA